MLIDVPCMCVCIFRWRERCCAGDRPSRGFSCAYIERDVRQHCQDAMMCRCTKAPTLGHGLYQCRQSLDVRAWLKPMQLHACSFLLSLAEAVVSNVDTSPRSSSALFAEGISSVAFLPCAWSAEFLRELWMRFAIFFQHLVPQLTARNPRIGFQGTSGFYPLCCRRLDGHALLVLRDQQLRKLSFHAVLPSGNAEVCVSGIASKT